MSINPTLFRKGACLGTGCLDHELLLLHPGGCSWTGMAIRQGINLSPDILVGNYALIKLPPKIASNIYTNKRHFQDWATYILHFLKILLASRANHPQYSHRFENETIRKRNEIASYLHPALPEDLASISCQPSPVLAWMSGPLVCLVWNNASNIVWRGSFWTTCMQCTNLNSSSCGLHTGKSDWL